MKLQTGILTAMALAIAAGAGYAVWKGIRRDSGFAFRNKLVLITGGSRGLGLATAREFGSQGAIVAICARDGHELDRARADLTSRGIRTHTFVCDITDREQVESMVAQIADLAGPVDILVNNAGIIQVGPFSR